MRITVNGEGCEVAEGITIARLLTSRGARERGSAVAVDGDVVPRSDWERWVLADGATVELVHAVQGG